MHIHKLFAQKQTLSFEVFPPKAGKSLEPLAATLQHLRGLSPDFVSCTYGAGGTAVGRSGEVCKLIADLGMQVLPHFTCVGNSRAQIEELMHTYTDQNIDNILLLRGDLKPGHAASDFAHASDLIEYFGCHYPQISPAAAAYPETHLDSISAAVDIEYLKLKQDLGATWLVTQLCFDVRNFAEFIQKVRDAGVTIPIVMGIMPVLAKEGLIKMALSNGCSIPKELSAIIGKYENSPEDFRAAGKEWTARFIERCESELAVAGFHFYTLNKYQDISEVLAMTDLLKDIREK